MNKIAQELVKIAKLVYADNYKDAELIEKSAKKLGYEDVYSKRAGTGTYYVYCDDLKIRVADHQDMYANSDYSADGYEGTVGGAVEFLAKKIGKPAPGWVKRRRTLKKKKEEKFKETLKEHEKSFKEINEEMKKKWNSTSSTEKKKVIDLLELTQDFSLSQSKRKGIKSKLRDMDWGWSYSPEGVKHILKREIKR